MATISLFQQLMTTKGTNINYPKPNIFNSSYTTHTSLKEGTIYRTHL